MGARLVGATYHPHWAATLTPVERVVLTAMALSALDNSNNPQRPAEQYHGGEDALVIALDGDLPDPDSIAYRTRTVAVNKVIGSLVRKGAIRRKVVGRRGTRAVYKLTLDSHLQPDLMDAQPVDNSPTNVRPIRQKHGGEHHPKMGKITMLTQS